MWRVFPGVSALHVPVHTYKHIYMDYLCVYWYLLQEDKHCDLKGRHNLFPTKLLLQCWISFQPISGFTIAMQTHLCLLVRLLCHLSKPKKVT